MSNSNELNPKDDRNRTTFIQDMEKKYRDDFVKQLCESFKQTHKKTLIEGKANKYFKTFAESLYDKSISGLGKGYGHFNEEERQKLVEAFHLQNSAFLKSLGDVAAQGSTFLWSDQKVGKLAAMDKDIREATGVFETGQALADTALGTLWDKIKVITDPDEALGLTWDNRSQAWNAISKEFAANAKGSVHVFLPKYIGGTTIFWNVELPELRKSGVNDITIHYLTDGAMQEVSEIKNNKNLEDSDKNKKIKEVLKKKETWENKKIKDSSIEIPKLSKAQKEEIIRFTKNTESSDIKRIALMDLLSEIDQAAKSITLSKLRNIGESWRLKALRARIERKKLKLDKLEQKKKKIPNPINLFKKLRLKRQINKLVKRKKSLEEKSRIKSKETGGSTGNR